MPPTPARGGVERVAQLRNEHGDHAAAEQARGTRRCRSGARDAHRPLTWHADVPAQGHRSRRTQVDASGGGGCRAAASSGQADSRHRPRPRGGFADLGDPRHRRASIIAAVFAVILAVFLALLLFNVIVIAIELADRSSVVLMVGLFGRVVLRASRGRCLAKSRATS